MLSFYRIFLNSIGKMDLRYREFIGSTNQIELKNHPLSILPDRALANGPSFDNFFLDQNTFLVHNFDPLLNNSFPSSSGSGEEDIHEDCDLSDAILGYISQVLMEEDMEEQTCMLQESLDFQAKEKSFYEVLGQKYPPSPTPEPEPEPTNRSYFYPINNGLPVYTSAASQMVSSLDSLNNTVDGFTELSNQRESVWQFRKGVEEANKFLPNGKEFFGLLHQIPNGEVDVKRRESKVEGRNSNSPFGSRGRKNPCREDFPLEEERNRKLAAVSTESELRTDDFDLILLHSLGKGKDAWVSYRKTLREETNKITQQMEQLRGPNGGKPRRKRPKVKKEVIDLRTLLINCAQAVAADDHRSANELLKQIRQHSCSFGDGNQRMAHCFADGLEARLAGTGSQIYKALITKRTSAADYLKAFQLYIASCPFDKISLFASSRTIRNNVENATSVHIIDFGIHYGFQWPTFFQRISLREGGPPRVRITGIEFPQPGFRPAERIEETGRRLAEYAKAFKVPFAYIAIAKKWENVKIEELKLEKDEFLVVNCLYRSKNLPDDTVLVENPRNTVNNLIGKINPNIFIHGIVNGAYGVPFFVTRFREALYHFSALFDMLDTNVPRGHSQRTLIEREIFGREALNVVACEGWERVERPETYKQWQVRNLRAGFVQIPLDRQIMKIATSKVRTGYHKDFLIDEDGHWLIQGWKGRIIYALSCWKPV